MSQKGYIDFIRAIVVAFVAAIALVSCAAPAVSDKFCAISDRDSLGRFVYDLEMVDSLAKYDISFYTRVDCGEKSFDLMQDIPIKVELLSPSGESFTEDLFWPKSRFDIERMGSYDSCVEYRLDCVPIEYGVWKMYLTVAPVRGLCGMGVILSAKK